MTRRSRGLARVGGTCTLSLALPAMLMGACGSVPDLTFESSDASISADDAGDGSAEGASPFSDACSFPCMGSACAANCAACAMCPSGDFCCAKGNSSNCRQIGKGACP